VWIGGEELASKGFVGAGSRSVCPGRHPAAKDSSIEVVAGIVTVFEELVIVAEVGQSAVAEACWAALEDVVSEGRSEGEVGILPEE